MRFCSPCAINHASDEVWEIASSAVSISSAAGVDEPASDGEFSTPRPAVHVPAFTAAHRVVNFVKHCDFAADGTTAAQSTCPDVADRSPALASRTLTEAVNYTANMSECAAVMALYECHHRNAIDGPAVQESSEVCDAGLVMPELLDQQLMDPGLLAPCEDTDEARFGPDADPTTGERPCSSTRQPLAEKAALDLGTARDIAQAGSPLAGEDDSAWVCPVIGSGNILLPITASIGHFIAPCLLPRICLQTSIGSVAFLVDTGAAASFLTPQYAEHACFRAHDLPSAFRAANGARLDVRGSIIAAVTLDGRRYLHQFLVGASEINILGYDFLLAHKLCPLYDPLSLVPYEELRGRRNVPMC